LAAEGMVMNRVTSTTGATRPKPPSRRITR
jgi:hypothetical protein